MTAERGDGPFDWSALVPVIVHPMKVAIIEAMDQIGEPLSATDMTKIVDGTFGVSMVSYHFTSLAKAGVIRKVGRRRVRGATETFYRLRPQTRD